MMLSMNEHTQTLQILFFPAEGLSETIIKKGLSISGNAAQVQGEF